MTLSQEHLTQVDQHWAVQAVGETLRVQAMEQAELRLVGTALGNLIQQTGMEYDQELLERVATAYELAAIEGLGALLHPASSIENQQLRAIAQAGAHRAFGLYRVTTLPHEDEPRLFHVLHLAGLAYCGDRWTDLRRWFEEQPEAMQIPSVAEASWDQRLLYRLFDCWVRLLRKNCWDDLDQISEIILGLRNDQGRYEKELLESEQGGHAQSLALRLVSLYHWAKATERLATYMLQGEPVAIDSELDQHFEAAIKAAQVAQDPQLEMVLRWLHVTSRKMVAGSLWWVAHTVNSRVTRFVSHLIKNKSFFELLPPQRIALQEQGLLDQASRAVIVDLPTSGGKTALAQFRMLQALNQFDQDDGWVAYVAPTRALVSQITRRLREDFGPLGIQVEALTGAIEVDAFEDALLGEQRAFQILVATPEKLQLVIRNKKVARPLALVVMDEAQNIEDEARGLRIELLLATIKQESPRANFLLLMPFVPNADDLAQWLAAERGKSISLGTSAWQPNERIVGLFNVERGEARGDWSLSFETLTTTQKTIHLRGNHKVDGNRPISALNYSSVNSSLSAQAVAMAKIFSKRGTSIAVAQKIPDVWSIARKVSAELEPFEPIPEDVALVQRFLKTEVSSDFELVDMLSKGVVVHHAGLPAEALSLIEWLTEIGHVRVMCATTTIAQGLNFPVSSVFLASRKYPYGKEMSHRAFWNLAGRAGRIGHDSVGVVGIAAGDNPNEIRQYVSEATESLVSRLVNLLDDLQAAGELNNLSLIINEDQWADFRSYIAHLWNEKRNLDAVIGEAEQLLRNTYGFGSLRAKADNSSNEKADALLEATKGYVRLLAEHPENASLADVTGFSPEGVRASLLELNNLENKLTLADWEPTSLFGDSGQSVLPSLMGIMMRIPQLKKGLEDIKGDGMGHRKLADISQSWVMGHSIEEIAIEYFQGGNLTDQISKACKAVYRDLANNGAWGLSALSKMPTSGIDFEDMSDDEKRRLNNLPAMLYHGVRTEEGVLMRMNSVPRSVAENAGADFKSQVGGIDAVASPARASEYLKSLKVDDWAGLKPESSVMSGEDYKKVWELLSGNS